MKIKTLKGLSRDWMDDESTLSEKDKEILRREHENNK